MSRIDVFVNSLDEVVVNNSIKELWIWSIWLMLIWLRDMQMDAGILFFFLTYADIENNRNVRNIILLYSILIL